MESEVSQSLWADLTGTLDNPQMMHALLVHTPIMFALFGFIVALCSLIFYKNKLLPRLTPLFFFLLAVCAWITSESGEKAEALVPNTLPAVYWDAINNHASMAERVWIFALVTMVLSLAVWHGNSKIRWSAKILTVTAAAVTNGWIAVTGHYGGELVYEYGIGTPALLVETHQAASKKELIGKPAQDLSSALSLDESVNFTKDIKPIFENYCTGCHNPQDSKGGLNMTDPEAFIRGGKKSGAPLIPGNPAESPLVKFILGHLQPQMPKDEKPLSNREIGLIAKWIENGALFDDDTSYEGVKVAKKDHAMHEYITKLMMLKEGTEKKEIKTDIRYKHLAKVATTKIPANPSTSKFAITDFDTLKRYRHSVRMQPLAAVEAPPYDLDTHPIDAFIAAWWKENSIEIEWNVCDDSTFIRRVFIDTIGLYPTTEQHEIFVTDTNPDKRNQLIDYLLSQDDSYAANWLPFWEDALCSNPETPLKFDWHGDAEAYLFDFMKKNKPLDQLVIDLLDMSSPTNIKTWIIRSDRETIGQSAANAAQIFMGESLRCAQCHNHFDNRKNTLSSFVGFASLFAPENLELVRCEKPTGQFVSPKFMYTLPDFDIPLETNLYKKTQLAARMVSDPNNPRFATTFVNRLWKRFLGLGLYEPMEDYRTEINASAPKLFAWLADDFIVHGYDIKHSMRQVLKSKVYQLEYDPAKADHFDETEPSAPRFFRSPQLRRLTGEQYLDNLQFILGYSNRPEDRTCFNNSPDTLARAFSIPATRNEPITDRDDTLNIFTALEIINGKKYSKYIRTSPTLGRNLKTLVGGTSYQVVMNDIYESLYNRPASETELQFGLEYARALPNSLDKDSNVPATLLSDLYWVLFSSPEFLYIP